MSTLSPRQWTLGYTALLAACCPARALVPGFYPLGDLPGREFHSHGYGISGDGSVAVGISMSANGPEAFRWTADEGMSGLGNLPGPWYDSNAYAASADGAVIVGASLGKSFRWTADGGMISLGNSGAAKGITPDGAVIVGVASSQAYRWTEADGTVGLGDLPGGDFRSNGFDVSSDGTVIVGHGESASGTEAFRWTAQTGMVGLGDLPGGPFHSEARGVSADGSVVVGFSDSASDLQAFHWTAAEGMIGLTPGVISVAVDVSADGSLIVGTSGEHGAFVWDEAHGVRSLESMLGLDLSDWIGIGPQGISDDGSTIVGFGARLSGENEAWIAVLPEPSTVALLLLGGLFAARRRRPEL